MTDSAGACKKLALQGAEGALVPLQQDMRTDTPSKADGRSTGKVGDKPTRCR